MMDRKAAANEASTCRRAMVVHEMVGKEDAASSKCCDFTGNGEHHIVVDAYIVVAKVVLHYKYNVRPGPGVILRTRRNSTERNATPHFDD